MYNEQFINQLIDQAINDKSRYKKVTHTPIEIGDLVLLKEACTKPSNYPMARVKRVTVNDLGEVTGAVVAKGATGEWVKRHSSAIIPLLRLKSTNMPNTSADGVERVPVIRQGETLPSAGRPPRRGAAVVSEQRSHAMLNGDL